MSAQLSDILYAERQGIGGTITVNDIVALSSGGAPIIKGTTNITFNANKEKSVFISNTAIIATSQIIPSIDINSDDILIENFEVKTKNEVGVGFTLFVNPKMGQYTGTVTIKYAIL